MKQQAKSENKQILLLFHIQDCPWCHFVINEVVQPMSELKEYTNKLIIRQIEIGTGLAMQDFNKTFINNDEFAQRYHIDFYPTLLLCNAQGAILEKVIGVANKDFYWTELDKLLNKHYLRNFL